MDTRLLHYFWDVAIQLSQVTLTPHFCLRVITSNHWHPDMKHKTKVMYNCTHYPLLRYMAGTAAWTNIAISVQLLHLNLWSKVELWLCFHLTDNCTFNFALQFNSIKGEVIFCYQDRVVIAQKYFFKFCICGVIYQDGHGTGVCVGCNCNYHHCYCYWCWFVCSIFLDSSLSFQ